MRARLALAFLSGVVMVGAVGRGAASAPATRAATRPRAPVPTRDAHTPGYPAATDLADGTVPSSTVDGNFVIGPTHPRAAEMTVKNDVPQGQVFNLTMSSAESKMYPGIARDANTYGTADPNDPAKMIVTTSHAAPYTRRVAVYVPKQYVAGTEAPFIVGADGPDRALFTCLDNLIAAHRVPAMVAISIGNGGGDAQGSERGLEYDTMSGKYAEFVQTEVLPLVEAQCKVKLTNDPDGRATMGGSSGGSCALIMAWYHPEWYHRVLTYSGTYVNQQWPSDPITPHGAWGFHEHLIPENPVKPIRIWLEVGDRDNFNANTMRDGMHDWVVANENMARVLAAKGYHYQFVFARNAGHTDNAVKQQTLPEALEYVWQGYSDKPKAAAAPGKTVPVTISGGHETDPRDRGRPVVLVAAGLGVPPETFREAFSHVKPAGPGQQPEPAQVQLNKKALMDALGKFGVTNDRLDEVSNMYRYPPGDPKLWKHTEAVVKATVADGKVTGFVVEKGGAGYTSEPAVSVEGFAKLKVKVTLHFGKELETNGSIEKVEVGE